MKCRTSEWITSFEWLLTCGIHRDAGFSVEFASLGRNTDVARSQRQTPHIVYGSPGDPAHDIQDALVVLISAAAVGLKAKLRFDRVGIGGENLNVEQNRYECERCGA